MSSPKEKNRQMEIMRETLVDTMSELVKEYKSKFPEICEGCIDGEMEQRRHQHLNFGIKGIQKNTKKAKNIVRNPYIGIPDHRKDYYMNYTSKAVAALQGRMTEIQQKFWENIRIFKDRAIPVGVYFEFLYGKEPKDGLTPALIDMMEGVNLETINEKAFGPFYTEVYFFNFFGARV